MALLLALARNIPQAYVVADGGQVGALEVLRRGALREDARHPRLRAHRPAGRAARAGLRHARARVRPVRQRRALPRAGRGEGGEQRGHLRAGRLHHDPPAQDARRPKNWLDAEAFAQDARRRAHPQRRARRPDRRSGAEGRARLGQGRRRGARRVPDRADDRAPAVRAIPTSIVTPHLGASTAEATDRAGYQSAEQVVAALTGGVVSTAVNIPSIGAEDMEVLGPFLPLATQLGTPRDGARRGQLGRAHRGGVHGPHRRLRHAPADARRDRRRAARAAPRSRSTSSTRPAWPRSAGSSSRRSRSPRRRTSTS